MAYIDKDLGEKIIERIYKRANDLKTRLNKNIVKHDIDGYDTKYLRGAKNGINNVLQMVIEEIRELEEE